MKLLHNFVWTISLLLAGSLLGFVQGIAFAFILIDNDIIVVTPSIASFAWLTWIVSIIGLSFIMTLGRSVAEYHFHATRFKSLKIS